MHSSLENEPVDLSGLQESVVDSDEDLADSIDVSKHNLFHIVISTYYLFYLIELGNSRHCS